MPPGNTVFSAIFSSQWFAGVWPEGCTFLSIAFKELVPMVLAATTWGAGLAQKRIHFKCDIISVVALLRRGSCKDRHLAFLLGELTLAAIQHSFAFTAIHVPGKRNVQADALSRSNFQAFHRARPDAEPLPLTIPQPLLQKLLFPPWTRRGKQC